MRATLIFLALLIAPLAAGNSVEFEDPSGDVTGPPGPSPSYIDFTLTNATLSEQELRITFTMAGVEQAPPSSSAALGRVFFSFAFDSVHYRIALDALFDTNTQQTRWTGDLDVFEEEWEVVRGLTVEGRGPTWQVAVPIDLVRGQSNTSPGPGSSVELLQGDSFYDALLTDLQGTARYEDMVDFEQTLLVVPGQAREGLEIRVADPIKKSNGQAKTFHWRIELESADGFEAVISADAPESISVRAPLSISVAANEATPLDVYATTAFRHQHGGQDQIQLRLDTGDANVRIDLGIHYFNVPQPTAHHPILYLHGFSSPDEGVRRWMDTESEPEASNDPQIEALGGIECEGSTGSGWIFPLQPSLQLGIDARIDELAKLTAEVTSPASTAQSSLVAALVVYDVAGWNPGSALNQAYAVHEEPWPSSSSFGLDLDLALDPALDLLEPESEQNLAIVLARCPANLAEEAVLRAQYAGAEFHLKDGRVALPLNEYADIDEVAPSSLRMSVENPHRSMPPGATALWRIDVDAPSHRTTLFGTDAHLATLEQESEGQVLVSMRVPPDALIGDNLAFIAETTDGVRTGAVLLSITVDPQSIDDDSDKVTDLAPGKDAPALALGVGAIALLIMCRRQRCITR